METAGEKVCSEFQGTLGDLLEDKKNEDEKRHQDGLKAGRCCFM
jgi:hypothetical protein